nr:peptidoglycan DD-metalloendopeptidase family protein [Acinetobacter sp. NCu2D-2]
MRKIRWAPLFLCFFIITLHGCSSSSKQQPPATLSQAQLAKLKRMPMPNRLPVPVDGVKAKQLRDTWGAARSQGRSHEGIDIMAPRGTKVLSSTEGLVADLRNNNLGGKVVWIRGPQDVWHYYAHLDKHKRGLKVGDYVKKGDVIGYVGNTGNARHTAPHLHYGIYLNGKGRGATNPYPYLR